MTTDAYRMLERRFERLSHLRGAEAVLHWDHACVMPPGGANARGGQLATLALVRHELLTEPGLADLLEAAEAAAQALDPWQRANLREMRRRWRDANALPERLVEALSRAASETEMVWREARAQADFALLAPKLEALLALVREKAACRAAALGVERYDALLDAYEPGLSGAKVDRLFAELAAFLPDLLGRVLAAQAARPAPPPLDGSYPVEAQRALAVELMAAFGFDFRHGRLDESPHPFTGGVPEDVRVTTRYTQGAFAEALMAVLHETGHALYERNLPARWRHQPVGRARGMVLHESQSLLVEMQVCRGAAFVGWLAPKARAAFGGSGAAWSAENLLRHYQKVERGPIRVRADEVSYPLHIILRARLERALLDGGLAVADLPGAWNDGMAELLGVRPRDDAEGCLQDIHWPGGDFGYFPTYTLGALAAAQLYRAARAALPDLDAAIARGDFAPLVAWLARAVHGTGSFESTDALLARVTGAPLSAAPFRRHLEARYLDPESS